MSKNSSFLALEVSISNNNNTWPLILMYRATKKTIANRNSPNLMQKCAAANGGGGGLQEKVCNLCNEQLLNFYGIE